jgi:hypothetical protein
VRRELAATAWRERSHPFTSTPEELVEETLGRDFALWRTLRARIPGAALVRVSFLDRREDYFELRRRLTRLESLSYPIVLKGWPYDPERPAPLAPGNEGAAQPGVGLVLDLDSGRDYAAWPVGEELARGEGFRLLRVGRPAPGEGGG